MIVCPNCGKENQDHYKFCLGCGSDLPKPEAESTKRPTPTPPTGIPAVGSEPEPSGLMAQTEPAPDIAPYEPEADDSQDIGEPAPSPEPPAPAPVEATRESTGAEICRACGARIAPGFAFCGSCGAPVPGAQPPAEVSSPAIAPDSSRLVLIQPDGTEGGHVEIPTSEVAVGRDAGGFFETDPFLSPTHAIFKTEGSEVVVRDAGSLNGVYFKITPNEPVEIKSGAIFRMGQELILFERIDRGSTAPDGTEKMGSPIEGLWGRVALIVGKGRLGNAFPVGGEGVVFGRERGNILFPEDGYVSGMHLKLHTKNNKFYLTDMGSSNGTFLKVGEEMRIGDGAFLLMGQQLFRVDL